MTILRLVVVFTGVSPHGVIHILKETESLLLQAKPISLMLTLVTRKSETGVGPAGRK